MHFAKDIELIIQKTLHTTLVDCALLSKVCINLIDQKEPTLDFQNQELENKTNKIEKILLQKNYNTIK